MIQRSKGLRLIGTINPIKELVNLKGYQKGGRREPTYFVGNVGIAQIAGRKKAKLSLHISQAKDPNTQVTRNNYVIRSTKYQEKLKRKLESKFDLGQRLEEVSYLFRN